MASICTMHEGLLGTSSETNKLLQVRTQHWLFIPFKLKTQASNSLCTSQWLLDVDSIELQVSITNGKGQDTRPNG